MFLFHLIFVHRFLLLIINGLDFICIFILIYFINSFCYLDCRRQTDLIYIIIGTIIYIYIKINKYIIYYYY